MTKPAHNPLPIWSIALPIAAWLVYFIGIKGSVPLQLIGGAMLIGSVLSAVHHAEVVAHKVGEPFGTIILALAITVLEVGLIVSMMMGGGSNAAYLARDTVFAAIMLILTGLLGVCLLILAVHKLLGGGTLGLLVLGFVLSAFSGAVVSMILFLSDDLVLRSATTWLSGSLAEAGFSSPVAAIAVMLPGFLILLSAGRRLDVLMTGEDTAASMGVSVGALRVQTVIGAALMTGAAVSLSGIIGFLGMMIPNVLAQTVGGSRRKLIALSAWLGAVFLMVVDGAARWLTYPVDLPVGIVIALLGGPFFMYLFIKPLKSR